MHDDYIGAGWAFPLRTNSRGGIALVRREQELEEAMRLILATYPASGRCGRSSALACATGCSAAPTPSRSPASRSRSGPPSSGGSRGSISKNVRVTRDGAVGNKLLIDIEYQALDTNDRRNLVFPFYTIPEDGSDY